MPAKPGCGATTVATYATAMAAELSTEPTLLLDFDIRLGVTSFLLKAEGAHTIVDALLQADRLDVDIWSGLVSQIKNLHMLGSGPMDFSRHVSTERFMELLDFALRRYSMAAVDLPGTMEDQECETLLRAKHIYLVCTPDIGALHVARRKASWLQDLRLTDKVSVVLNCVERRSTLSVDDIQRIVQLPVRHLLPASASEITRAVQKGAVLETSSGLGKHIARIASEMAVNRPLPKRPGAVRRFVEYFSVSAARDGSD
jgi:pilus assembly protein CpaE